MKLHTEIDIPDVESIRTQALKIISPDNYNDAKPLFANIPDSKNVFLGIPELKRFLDRQGWTGYITGIMFNVIQAKTVSLIHTDAPMFNKSFNIPLCGYEESYVDFFAKKAEPTLVNDGNNAISTEFRYWTFEREDVELIERYKTSGPYMLRTEVPHQVINDGPSKRVNLLVRLSHKLDISKHYV
jgi:hypothetical protein